MNILLEKLSEKGVEVEDTLKRFMGAEELYVTFVARYPQEEAYANLKNALETNAPIEKIESYAHAFKGNSGNLGMKKLYELLYEIEKNAKTGELLNSAELFEQAEKEYKIICEIIRQYS